MSGLYSRNKGKRGERALRDILRESGFEARRGKQFSGDESAPDVICPDLPELHWEAKWCESGNPYAWLEQAQRDCGTKMPIVVHKRNFENPIAVMPISALMTILRRSDLPRVGSKHGCNHYCGLVDGHCSDCGLQVKPYTSTPYPGFQI